MHYNTRIYSYFETEETGNVFQHLNSQLDEVPEIFTVTYRISDLHSLFKQNVKRVNQTFPMICIPCDCRNCKCLGKLAL